MLKLSAILLFSGSFHKRGVVDNVDSFHDWSHLTDFAVPQTIADKELLLRIDREVMEATDRSQ